MDEQYRRRIYEGYVSAQGEAAPTSVEDFASRAPYCRDLIARRFPADRASRIFDLGCGHGALLYFLREAGYENVAGVDVSPDQVDVARRLGIPGVVEGDLIETLEKLPEASQDVVIAFDVIEHLSKDAVMPLVDAVRRVLRPGGRWILHAPNGESPFFGRIRYGDFTHELAFTRQSIDQILRLGEFSRVEVFESEPLRKGARGWARWLVWRVFRSVLRLYLAAESGSGRNAILTQGLLAIAYK